MPAHQHDGMIGVLRFVRRRGSFGERRDERGCGVAEACGVAVLLRERGGESGAEVGVGDEEVVSGGAGAVGGGVEDGDVGAFGFVNWMLMRGLGRYTKKSGDVKNRLQRHTTDRIW